MWMIASFFFNEESGRISTVAMVTIAVILGVIVLVFLIIRDWFRRWRFRKLNGTTNIGSAKLPTTDQIVDIDPSLTRQDIHRILKHHKIPVNMKLFPISVERNSGGSLLLRSIAGRLRITFSVDPDAKLDDSHVNRGDYSSDSTLDFDWGCRRYVETLEEADRIVLYPDIPCVICHLRKQDNQWWDEFKLCFRPGKTLCYVGSFSFKCSPDVTAQREDEASKARIAKEKALYGSDGSAILQAARAAADSSRKSTPRSGQNLIGWAAVTAEINGHKVRWSEYDEVPAVNAGAEAFSKVLKEHGIDSSITTGLD